MVGIYMFTNKYDNKSYVGQSTNIRKRYNSHKRACDNILFHDYIKWYGFDAFDFRVLEECDKSELDEKEIYYIKKYNTVYPNGYNLSYGGNSPKLNRIHSFSDVDKIKDYLKNTTMSNEEIGKIFGISDQAVSDINNGKTWYVDNTKYPIRKRSIKVSYCSVCGKELSYGTKSKICRECSGKLQRKVVRPDKNELYTLLTNNTFVSVAKKFGVTDNAIKRWCDYYKIPRYSKYYTELKKGFVIT